MVFFSFILWFMCRNTIQTIHQIYVYPTPPEVPTKLTTWEQRSHSSLQETTWDRKQDTSTGPCKDRSTIFSARKRQKKKKKVNKLGEMITSGLRPGIRVMSESEESSGRHWAQKQLTASQKTSLCVLTQTSPKPISFISESEIENEAINKL